MNPPNLSTLQARRAAYEERLRKIHARLKDRSTIIGLGYDEFSPEDLRAAAFQHALWIYHTTWEIECATLDPSPAERRKSEVRRTK